MCRYIHCSCWECTLLAVMFTHTGSVILLENLRFHIAEEGKGKDSDGQKASSCHTHRPLVVFDSYTSRSVLPS